MTMHGTRDGAVALVLDHLASIEPGERPLIVGNGDGAIAAALSGGSGCRPSSWLRWAGGAVPATTWPPQGPHTCALVRLPKGKAARAFCIEASASVVAAGAPVVLFGMNEEGIRSASRALAIVCDGVQTAAVGHHARLLAGRRRCNLDVAPTLDGWRVVRSLPIGGVERSWVTYPGLFADGRIDEGTALLIANLPQIPVSARVLDYGCGTGIVAAHVQVAGARCSLDLLDADALALKAAAENVPEGHVVLGTSLADVEGSYDLIISNPPTHQGVIEDRQVLERLIAQALSRLKAGGILQIVVQTRMAVIEALQRAFSDVERVAANARFTVYRARRHST
jgi:16S rRNA (guanine1207-N2)-methyltransferase